MHKADTGEVLTITVSTPPLEPLPTGLEPGGSLQRPLRALLFDIYGTLLISASGDIALARERLSANTEVAALLARMDIQTPPDELCNRFAAAVQADHARQQEKGIDWPEVVIEEIWADVLGLDDLTAARRFALAFEMAVNPVYPMPHAAALLAEIRQTSLTAGIISNAQFYTPLLLAHIFQARPEEAWADPDLLFYSYQHGRAKPSRYMFDQAAAVLERRGISPGQTLYVGNDMRNDVRPAAESGFQTALFAGDARSLRLREEDGQLNDTRPDLVITDLAQLRKYLPPAVQPYTNPKPA
ncbi:MAG: HAD family hydrolase [Desulfosudaceae bacterium]